MHLGKFEQTVLVELRDEGRLQIGGELKVSDMEAAFGDAGEREALRRAEVERPRGRRAPFDDLKFRRMGRVFVRDVT